MENNQEPSKNQPVQDIVPPPVAAAAPEPVPAPELSPEEASKEEKKPEPAKVQKPKTQRNGAMIAVVVATIVLIALCGLAVMAFSSSTT